MDLSGRLNQAFPYEFAVSRLIGSGVRVSSSNS